MDRLQKRIALALCGVLAVVVALALSLSGGGSAKPEDGIVSGDSSIAARAAALGVSEEELEAEQEASERTQRILDLSLVMHKDITTSPFYNPRSQIDAAPKDEELAELCDSMTEEARKEMKENSLNTTGYGDVKHTCESGWALQIRRERQANVGRIRSGEIEKLPSYRGRVTGADYRDDTVVVTIQFGNPRTKPAQQLTLVDDDGEWKMGGREQIQSGPPTPAPKVREEDFGSKPRSDGKKKSGD